MNRNGGTTQLGGAAVVDLGAYRQRKRQRTRRHAPGYVFGAGDAPRILHLDRQLADRGVAPAQRLAHVLALPDQEYDALWRNLARHVEQARTA